MLMAMRAALVREGGEVRNAAVIGFEPGRVRMTDAEAAADALVLASGLPPAGFAEPPVETARLWPIKGQIMRARGAAPRTGPVIRGAGVYVVPGQDGPWIGATMEAGAGDRRIDPSATARLCAQASMLFPDLVRADVEASAGVRASTPDGLPLVGESARAGLFMALGARRNGWLLAPMVGELIARRLAGGDVPASLQARRFEAARVS
jgi:glycine oxidase